ncbi:MAG: hypothetical protein P0119_19825 [Nitrospira sp.]|nr:hypothetical protein [Nitrospira sp.]
MTQQGGKIPIKSEPATFAAWLPETLMSSLPHHDFCKQMFSFSVPLFGINRGFTQ